ncbi:amidohydrolase [Catellatospora sp. IY07-71]|uniref:amidohydrolase family protein n=1 Tax=Catellatospora sp. IY07-71 TaxID=2728827 RepID=UPI001BB43E55|nr:amidohydrolase family protein [Catellatospora sp. IY07-71]BCJ76386.1 amidohydrolase [Catellatospora sp. IY07-71]
MIIDAHVQLWTADSLWAAAARHPRVRRDHDVDALRASLAASEVDACVLVEAGPGTSADTTRCLEIAAWTPWAVGVVGWAPLTDPDLGDIIGKHRAEPGGQHLVALQERVYELEEDFLDRPGTRAGLTAVAECGLAIELAVRTEQLPSVARLAEAMPGARIVLQQAGSPWVTGGAEGLAEWQRGIEPVAACGNVRAKLSGLVTLAHWDRWSVDDLRPYVDHAVEVFGARRLMFGSDWPTSELAATYPESLRAIASLLGGLHRDVFAETAVSTYQLELSDVRPAGPR